MSDEPLPASTSRWPYLAGALAVLLTIGLGWWILDVRGFTPEEASVWLRSAGHLWWVPLAFFGLYALFAVLMIPSVPLSVAAALMWGWALGGLIELVVFTLSSIIPFLLARSTLGSWIEAKIPATRTTLYERLRKEGFFLLLVLRFVPLIPSPLLNYMAGLARLRFRDYIAATFLGSIPSVFIFTYLVDSVATATVSVKGAFFRTLIAGVLIVLLALLARRLKRVLKGDPSPPAQPPRDRF